MYKKIKKYQPKTGANIFKSLNTYLNPGLYLENNNHFGFLKGNIIIRNS